MQQSPKTSYRSDINGLRAWAVLAVVLFHFKVPYFGGGFVGVDVFFVISGFLMTSIIVPKLQSHNFNYLAFCFARTRRIVPALVFLVCVLIILGYFLLPTVELQKLSKHSISAVSFVSNILFDRESGYFDQASETKWLLHTWSLSVEWQFYLIFPLLLMLLGMKGSMRLIAFGIIAMFVFSLSTSIYYSGSSSSYFLLHTRAWEMLAGGIVWLLSRQTIPQPYRTLTFSLGFVFIILSILLFDKSTSWPSYNALLPTLGAAMVILARSQSTLLTDNRIFQWVGTRSYSIYLWHWPIYVASVYSLIDSYWFVTLSGILLSLLLGQLSYNFIENKGQKTLSKSTYKSQFGLVFIALSLCIFVCFIFFKFEVPGRIEQRIEIASNEATNFHPLRTKCHISVGSESPGCIYGGEDIAAILIGDSHADSVVSSIQEALPSQNNGVLGWTYSGCPTIFEARTKSGSSCQQFNSWVKAEVKGYESDIPLIIVNSLANALNQQRILVSDQRMSGEDYRDTFVNKYKSSICELAQDRKVYITSTIPSMDVNVPNHMARTMTVGKKINEVTIPYGRYLKDTESILSAQRELTEQCDNVTLLDVSEYLCDKNVCYGSEAGRPLYFDATHLSEFGNKKLVPLFLKVFQ